MLLKLLLLLFEFTVYSKVSTDTYVFNGFDDVRRWGFFPKLNDSIGFIFTPTAVIASHRNTAGEIEILHEQPISLQYRSLYRQAVRDYTRDTHYGERMFTRGLLPKAVNTERVVSVFGEAFNSISEAHEAAWGHRPDFTAIFVPSVFDMYTRRAIPGAILGESFDRLIKIDAANFAIAASWGFFEGQHIDRQLEDLNDEGPVNMILVMEYERDYLYIFLKEVSWDLKLYATHQQSICKKCGERVRKAIGEASYRERINSFIAKFVNNEVLKNHQRESVRAIVVAGEASEAAAHEVGTIARAAIRTEIIKVMTSIPSLKVVAHGAAVWVRTFGSAYQKIPCMFWHPITDERYAEEMEKEKVYEDARTARVEQERLREPLLI